MKRWWLKELTILTKEKNKLSKISCKFRGTPDHPAHNEHRTAMNKLHSHTDKSKKAHWVKWLENTTTCNIYTANKYINSKPSDYSNTCIPDLKTYDGITCQEITASDNTAKAEALASMFFPPPLSALVIPASAYPEPLKAKGFFTRNDIRKAIRKLKVYKAPGVDGI